MYNQHNEAGAAFMALTNREKQARFLARRLGPDGEKVRVGLILNATANAQMRRLARHKGYTLTALIEELVASAERRVTARLSGHSSGITRVNSGYDGIVITASAATPNIFQCERYGRRLR